MAYFYKNDLSIIMVINLYVSINGTSNDTFICEIDGEKVEDPNRRLIKITGVSIGLGKRLKWPDDYFSVNYELGFQHYDLNNFGNVFSFANGKVNNPYFKWIVSRSSIDQPLYPRSG